MNAHMTQGQDSCGIISFIIGSAVTGIQILWNSYVECYLSRGILLNSPVRPERGRRPNNSVRLSGLMASKSRTCGPAPVQLDRTHLVKPSGPL